MKKEEKCVKENRYGRIMVSRAVLVERPKFVEHLKQFMTITRTDDNKFDDIVEFTGYSDQFVKVTTGQPPLLHKLIITKEDDKEIWEFGVVK